MLQKILLLLLIVFLTACSPTNKVPLGVVNNATSIPTLEQQVVPIASPSHTSSPIPTAALTQTGCLGTSPSPHRLADYCGGYELLLPDGWFIGVLFPFEFEADDMKSDRH